MTISSVSAGGIIDPAWGNAVADKLNQTDDAWTTFTPTWINVTIGNATVAAAYRYELGNLHVRAEILFGSTTVFTGSARMDLPNSETAASDGLRSLGNVTVKDGSADDTGHCMVPTAGTDMLLFAGGNNINATSPFTWITGDQIQIDIVVIL